MQELYLWLHERVGLSPLLQGKLASTIVALLMLWLLKQLLNTFINKKFTDSRLEYQAHKTAGYLTLFIGVLIVGRIWFEGFQSLSTIIGLASAGIAIALKDPLVNMAAWLYIIWDDPFDVGHRIEIGGIKGDIVDQNMFHFTLMEIGNWIHGDQATGRMIHVPNGKVFSEPLHNYNDDFPYLWDELHVRITFESDWQEAKKLVKDSVERHTTNIVKDAAEAMKEAGHKFMINRSDDSLESKVYLKVTEWGVLLTVRYVVPYQSRRILDEQIWEDILTSFEERDDITFAYPTWRVLGGKSEPIQQS